jgi:acetolactate synthase-1/3 small subunit
VKHIIQAIVENKFGVLSRVASLFSARGYNIHSLAVGETHDPTISCITMVVEAPDEMILEQINKQLHKLIEVIKVVDYTRKDHIDRELLLIKVKKTKTSKAAITKITKKYLAKVISENKTSTVVEVCAEKNEVEKILEALEKIGIKELVRTGRVAIEK